MTNELTAERLAEWLADLEGVTNVTPFTASIPKHAKWCQPGDRQDKRMFIVRFDDQDMRDAVFEDEAQAREFYARATVSWNCWLFGALPVQSQVLSDAPALRSLIALAQEGLAGRKTYKRLLEKRIEEIVDEHGDYEPDTNFTNLPEWAETVIEELENLIAALEVAP